MKYIRRLVWFIAKKLIVWFVLLGILVCAFFMCMDLANIYVLLDDGMAQRTEVILKGEGAQELGKYFTADFINADPALTYTFDGTSVYNYYNISNYTYKLTIENMWVWPWDDHATATVVERVPSITGKVLPGHSKDVPAGDPTLGGGRYKITLKEDNGHWLIAGMQQTTEIYEAANTKVK